QFQNLLPRSLVSSLYIYLSFHTSPQTTLTFLTDTKYSARLLHSDCVYTSSVTGTAESCISMSNTYPIICMVV
ncbi:hypothetical protein PAK38_19020, partial [Proteus mirabilis]|uniref:hypothetical protein n=1 Tax=Proteus mirabilis TaxID=584 RepID=UPI0025766044